MSGINLPLWSTGQNASPHEGERVICCLSCVVNCEKSLLSVICCKSSSTVPSSYQQIALLTGVVCMQKLDPGAAVALGAPLLVRMFVPLWVVNATPLPVAAWVVPIQPPQAPADKDQHSSEALVDPSDSIRLETLETENVQMPQGTSRR